MLQVKLREIVDYVAGVIAQNAVSSSVKKSISSQAAAAAGSIHAQAEQPIAQALMQLGTDAKTAVVVEHVKSGMVETFEQLTASGVQQVRQEAKAMSERSPFMSCWLILSCACSQVCLHVTVVLLLQTYCQSLYKLKHNASQTTLVHLFVLTYLSWSQGGVGICLADDTFTHARAQLYSRLAHMHACT